MKSYNKNNIRIKTLAKWTGDDGIYLTVNPINDCEDKQTIVITTDELRDILYLGTKIFIENDPEIMKADITDKLQDTFEKGR
jgi:hypothetical protein